ETLPAPHKQHEYSRAHGASNQIQYSAGIRARRVAQPAHYIRPDETAGVPDAVDCAYRGSRRRSRQKRARQSPKRRKSSVNAHCREAEPDDRQTYAYVRPRQREPGAREKQRYRSMPVAFAVAVGAPANQQHEWPCQQERNRANQRDLKRAETGQLLD